MNFQQEQQKIREKAVENKHQEDRLRKQSKTELQKAKPPLSTSASPSSSSSPSHEFSFSVSLHSLTDHNKFKHPPSDLSPADDIFFHGHLLPLHFLSHLPLSPRSSTNSLDSFTLPIRENPFPFPNQKPNSETNTETNSYIKLEKRGKAKSKSFSFGFSKLRKDEEEKLKQKRKSVFDLSHLLKRYADMVRPSLLFSRRKGDVQLFSRQSHSFSDNLRLRKNEEMGGERRIRRGEISAPASMRASPTNSGYLLGSSSASAVIPSSSSSISDSTMEELQAAIQAAIAHCKNSISKEDSKLQC